VGRYCARNFEVVVGGLSTEEHRAVQIQAIGLKEGNRLFVAGEEVV
jgi:hypothetical protein